jgi:Flp pilus assembly protein TadG
MKAKFTSGMRRKSQSGQALVEMAFVTVMMIGLAFGLVDFCRAIFVRQVLTNLSREAANLAARGTGSSTQEIMSNAVAAVTNSAAPLNLTTTNAYFVVTAVTNNNAGGTFVRYQLSTGKLTPQSAVGLGIGHVATLPHVTPALSQPRHTVYVAEIYYKYTPITPVGKWFSSRSQPTIFRDAAYFPGG